MLVLSKHDFLLNLKLSKYLVIEKYSHHKKGLSAQINFKQQVLGLIETIEDIGSPFLDDTTELQSSDKHPVIDEFVYIPFAL